MYGNLLYPDTCHVSLQSGNQTDFEGQVYAAAKNKSN
jgi:hypothetical protein